MPGQSRFKAGSLVSVKSGGPPMTVNQLLEDGGVQCVWHLKDGTLQRGGVFTEALKLERVRSGSGKTDS